MPQNLKQKKSKNHKEIVELADKIRRDLGDTRPKSFGLYVKLIKDLGASTVNDAFWRTVRSKADDKVRYFLGIISNIRSQKETLRAYRSLRNPLLKKMSPPNLPQKSQRAQGRNFKTYESSRNYKR